MLGYLPKFARRFLKLGMLPKSHVISLVEKRVGVVCCTCVDYSFTFILKNSYSSALKF